MATKAEKIIVSVTDNEVLSGANVDVLIIERQLMAQQEKDAKERKAEIDEHLQKLLVVAGVDGVLSDGVDGELWKVYKCGGKAADQVSKTALLSLGVAPEIIQKATTPGKEYTYLRADNLNKIKDEDGV